MTKPIALASKSPRRSELLSRLDVAFEVIDNQVEEIRQPNEPADTYVVRLARAKAVAGANASKKLTIGADTIGVLDDEVLEKPIDQADAYRMWSKMAGRSHRILTAVAVSNGEQTRSELVESRVYFSKMTAQEMAYYWETGEPQDKAGGYGIQGIGALFVDRIEGVYDAVVGLPLAQTARLLRQFGCKVLGAHE